MSTDVRVPVDGRPAPPTEPTGGAGGHPGRRWWWGSATIVVIVWSFRGTGADMRALVASDALGNMTDFLSGFLRPDLSPAYLAEVAKACVETIQMSFVAMVFALVLASPLSMFAASNLTPNQDPYSGWWNRTIHRTPYVGSRGTLNLCRAVPELVWALVFITAVGLGPFAGALAIGLHASGLLGKLWAEQFEAVDPGPMRALERMGAGRTRMLRSGAVPMARQGLASLTLYQWECCLRAATVVGFVGAGGIGQQIDVSIRLFRYQQTSTLILAVLLLVSGADALGALIRKRIR